MRLRGGPPFRISPVFLALLWLLPALAVFPGCGGGDGIVSGSGDTVIPPGDTTPPPNSPDPPVPPVSGAPDPGVADIHAEFLDAVNAARSSARSCGGETLGPSPPVAWSDALAMAAYLHSKDMAENGFFSHTGTGGSSPGDRIERQGYDWRTYGENIAVGYGSVSAVIQGWIGSPGHCRNLMSASFTEIGAGYAAGPYGGNPSACYWTFDLAD